LQRAARLAGNVDARLTLATTIKDPSVSAGEIEGLRKQLDAMISAPGVGNLDARSIVLIGTPFLEIIRQVLRERHDLVIMGAEDERSIRSYFLGSTAFHLLRKCPCPVWITRRRDKPSYARILAAVDPDPDNPEAPGLNRTILDLATSFAAWNGGELHVVPAWDVDRHERTTVASGISGQMKRKILNKAKDRARKLLQPILSQHDFGGLKYRTHFPRGEAGAVVSKLVERRKIDLIVMGTVCRTGIPGFLIGNTAEYFLHSIDCAILAAKPIGFATPVTLDH